MAMEKPYRTPEQKDKPEDTLEYQEITDEQLKTILEQHVKWVESKGYEGEQAVLDRVNLLGKPLSKKNLQGAIVPYANLQKTNLASVNLQEAFLVHTKLQHAYLADANLRKADLGGTNLQQADLRGAKLQQAHLKNAVLLESDLEKANLQQAYLVGANLHQSFLYETAFRDANLQNATLTEVKGLLASQLAGCNVSGAHLPDDIKKFEGLGQADRISQRAQKLFLSILLGCVYCWLTIATTTDLALILNTGSSPLPIIQTKVPLADFYKAAPFILLGLYLWFHLYLLRLWERLAQLPAIFQDGEALDEKVYPWLISGMVRAHVRLLKVKRPALSSIQNFISIFLAWWMVPLTFLMFWLRYIPAHEWVGTSLHVSLLAISITVAIFMHRLGAKSLQGKTASTDVEKDVQSGQLTASFIVFSWLMSTALIGVSTSAIGGTNQHVSKAYSFTNLASPSTIPEFPWPNGRNIAKQIFHLLGYRAYANLEEVDISTKPDKWTGTQEEKKKKEETALVRGADLRSKNLNNASMVESFAVKARLDYAHLKGAGLMGIDLREADLTRAVLWGADLRGADLTRADLWGADLQRTDLGGVNLTKAKLVGTKLTGADLTEARLYDVKELTVDQLKKAKNWVFAHYDGKWLDKLGLPENHEKNLKDKSLKGYDLSNMNLIGTSFGGWDLQSAKLTKTQLYGADLRGAKNFTQKQLNEACVDKTTKLPE